ncbi:MAG TPA: molybdopterin-dependent oxidoreductase, partial [Acidobacteriota bacterium]|nr:molybdopterin-dependent oxidoreductase [Acidobacteriota bacterium]
FIVFQGVNWNSTAERASLVLPGATHAEKDGTFTNFEGRIQRFKQAFVPLEEARADTEILKQLAAKLGHPVSYLDPETIFIEWQGIGYDEIDEYGMMVGSAPALQA